MDMTGSVRIPAPRQAVWDGLNDPAVLGRCIPGCEQIERQGDDVFTARVTAKIGPVSAKFTGKVTLRDIDRPNGYTLAGEGQGGAAGFGKGEAKVALSEEGGETVLTYVVKAQVGGKLAQIGSRLVDAAARKLADEFFAAFAAAMGEGAAQTSAPAAAPAEPGPGFAGMPGLLAQIPWAALVLAGLLALLLKTAG